MAKFTPRGNDKDLLRKINRNVSSKKSRLRNKFDLEIPEVETKPLKEFNTRKEFNQYVRKMQSFTNRYNTNYQFKQNQHGVTMSQKDINEIERKLKAENQEKARQFNRIKNKLKPEKGEYIPKNINDFNHPNVPERLAGFRPHTFNFDLISTKKTADNYKNLILGREIETANKKAELMRTSMIKALIEVAGKHMSQNVINKLNGLSPKQIALLYYNEEDFRVKFVYSPEDDEDILARLEEIIDGQKKKGTKT
jgi:hypothetical protein